MSRGPNNRFFYISAQVSSRRRYPHIIRSDTGTNFVGVESELKTALKGLDKNRTEEEVNNNQTKWLFNPPCSPWMSGAMESMVKVTKLALKAVIKERTFADDALYTIMTEVKSTVNTGPLTYVVTLLMITKQKCQIIFCWVDDPITLQLLTTKKLM